MCKSLRSRPWDGCHGYRAGSSTFSGFKQQAGITDPTHCTLVLDSSSHFKRWEGFHFFFPSVLPHRSTLCVFVPLSLVWGRHHKGKWDRLWINNRAKTSTVASMRLHPARVRIRRPFGPKQSKWGILWQPELRWWNQNDSSTPHAYLADGGYVVVTTYTVTTSLSKGLRDQGQVRWREWKLGDDVFWNRCNSHS